MDRSANHARPFEPQSNVNSDQNLKFEQVLYPELSSATMFAKGIVLFLPPKKVRFPAKREQLKKF